MEANTPKFKIRLGLFIIGGILLFLVGLFFLGKQKNLFNPVFKLTTSFNNISGLEVGCNIRFAGLNVGTVDNIGIINDSTVKVDLLVNRSVQQFIKEDCQASIGSDGIIGDRVLVITQGGYNSSLAKEGQHIESKEPIETDAIMASIQKTAGSIEIITKQLAGVMIKVNSGEGTLGRLIHDDDIAQDLSESSVYLKNTSKQISNILDDIHNGKGTLGKIISDPNVSEDISITMVNLKNSSKGLDDILEAAKHNFLFKGYFKNKEKDSDIDNEKEGRSRENYRVEERIIRDTQESNLENQIQLLTAALPIEVDTLMANLQVTIANSEIISKQLVEIISMKNSGRGTIGMLVQDTVLASVINQTLLNMKSSSKGLDENMNAAKENFFLKGYFERKKKAAAEKEKIEQNEKKKK
ncbi:MAG TPA: MlaD family protein [Prolixibacteraceae bacterium]|nr:MlaD family protein [Prolixibacteraceae bacterium]